MTLSESQTLLSRYAGANNTYADRLNLVLERLLTTGDWKGSKQLTTFSVYYDADGNSIVTLPRSLRSIRAGAFQDGLYCAGPMEVRNSWYEFLPNGTGVMPSLSTDSFVPIEGKFTTYRDWLLPLYLRLKFETAETNGLAFTIKGSLAGRKWYTDMSGTWTEGVKLTYSGSNLTTSQLFDERPYQIVKPVTKGRVTLCTVDSDGTETEVAVYEPNETNPNFRRYKVPGSNSQITATSYSLVGLDLTSFYTRTELDAMFGASDTITISSTSGSPRDLNPGQSFRQWYQQINANAGTGSYTYNFSLNRTWPKVEAVYHIYIVLAQSSNPTINIYDNSVGGTLLQIVHGDSSNATYFLFEGRFDGVQWTKLSGTYVT